jgi:2-hydroxychromene-2-carboxylate isomerase
MAAATIDFWFSIGSTYSYLSAMRLAGVESREGVAFVWRPFSVRAIMREMDNIPFATKPVKLAYMWRDLGRRAALYGLRPKLPAPYPLQDFDLANQVAILGAAEGWCADYVRTAYRLWFEQGEPAGSEPNLSDSLSEIGLEPGRVIERARDEATEAAYRAATDEARRLGIFGSPTFVVDRELFWGDDRLDDAIAWRREGRLAPV